MAPKLSGTMKHNRTYLSLISASLVWSVAHCALLRRDHGSNFLLEGDIAIESHFREVGGDNRRLAHARSEPIHLWPEGRIPYRIADDVNRDVVEEAIDHWVTRTGIFFSECYTCDETTGVDFLHFQKDVGCWSFVGYKRGSYVNDPFQLGLGPGQPISADTPCTVGNMIHEIGHALGLWHEHTRPDRDDYVTINYDNVNPDYTLNFEKREVSTMIGVYDYGSIMHYRDNAFAIDNNEPTILTKDVSMQAVIGQRTAASAKDVAAIKILYELADTDEGEESTSTTEAAPSAPTSSSLPPGQTPGTPAPPGEGEESSGTDTSQQQETEPVPEDSNDSTQGSATGSSASGENESSDVEGGDGIPKNGEDENTGGDSSSRAQDDSDSGNKNLLYILLPVGLVALAAIGIAVYYRTRKHEADDYPMAEPIEEL